MCFIPWLGAWYGLFIIIHCLVDAQGARLPRRIGNTRFRSEHWRLFNSGVELPRSGWLPSERCG